MLFGATLCIWYGFKWWKMLSTAIIVWVIAYLYPHQPLIPYVMGVYLFSMWLVLEKGELKTWLDSTWGFAKLIIPLLFIGVMIAGSLLGRPGQEAWVPSNWIATAVGRKFHPSKFLCFHLRSFMYFATLTEVPSCKDLSAAEWGRGLLWHCFWQDPPCHCPACW